MQGDEMKDRLEAASAEALEAARSEPWLLIKRDLYERPNRMGYTGFRDEAGRYSFDEAVAHAKHYGLDHAVRLSEADEFRASAYSDLVINHLTKQRDEAKATVTEMQTTRPRATIGEMKTSEGADYYVMLECAGRECSILKLRHRWQAEYERDHLNWVLSGGEMPDLLNYGRAARATPSKEG